MRTYPGGKTVENPKHIETKYYTFLARIPYSVWESR
jgi:hypothetical protein